MDNRKRTYSLRMNVSDMRKIQQLAKRLGTHESDVIRYAVRSMLTRLGPLHDPSVRGRSLLPAFLESGFDFFHHFDLDAARLDGIINDGAEDDRRVDAEDIQLVAMTGLGDSFVRWQRGDARPAPPSRSMRGADGEGSPGGFDGVPAIDPDQSQPLWPGAGPRAYLYEKYIYRTRGGSAPPPRGDGDAGRIVSLTKVGAAYSDRRPAIDESRNSRQTKAAIATASLRSGGPEKT